MLWLLFRVGTTERGEQMPACDVSRNFGGVELKGRGEQQNDGMQTP